MYIAAPFYHYRARLGAGAIVKPQWHINDHTWAQIVPSLLLVAYVVGQSPDVCLQLIWHMCSALPHCRWLGAYLDRIHLDLYTTAPHLVAISCLSTLEISLLGNEHKLYLITHVVVWMLNLLST